ncbi:MAG TPA: fluoride efflux transporter CrcB [Gaiellaceae bacterium]|nr:fluoride efflux transporter CrcB [Gaiellaceae bacterium]
MTHRLARDIDRRLQAAVFAGGVGGALARAGIAAAFPWDGRGWPWPTFAINAGGTLLLGYLATRLQERLPPSTYRRPLLGTGFCGALTTFSTFQVELIDLARHGAGATAAGYAAASVAGGLVGVYLATASTRRVRLR